MFGALASSLFPSGEPLQNACKVDIIQILDEKRNIKVTNMK